MREEHAGSPKVLLLTGLPGTGKSTLAEASARSIGAPAFMGDWLMGALAPTGVLTGLDRSAYSDLYYRLLRTLMTRQLMLGQSAVLDCLVTDAVVHDWRKHVAEFDAQLYVVECLCSDVELHRSRIEGRRRGIPGWHEIGWDHVERMRVEYPPLQVDHLSVDAAHPLESNQRDVLRFMEN